MSDPINGHMATILGEMRANRSPRTRDEILAALDGAMSYTVFIRAVRALVYDGHIDTVRARVPNQKVPALIAINESGLYELRMFKRREKEALRNADKARVVPPRRIDLFALPVLSLTGRRYQRNDGHKHIGSRGAGC